MNTDLPDLIKHQEIEFRDSQAQRAVELLSLLPCVSACKALSEQRLEIDYDVRDVTLCDLLCLLDEAGFRIERSLLSRLRFALADYVEDNQRRNMGCTHESGHCAREMFMKCYDRREHGCRDPLPGAWREYQ